MTGPEHYREAERLTEQADAWMNADTGWKAHLSSEQRISRRMADLAAAQVHATLALAAATATHAEAPVAELKTAPTIVYRAEHPDSGITLGHYGTPAAARAHCEATERRSWPTGTTLAFDWIEDEDQGVAELVVAAGQNEESTTGYMVTALELASEYDEEADE